MSNKQAHFADEEYNHVAQASKCGQSNVSTAAEDKMVRTIIKDVSDTSIDKSGPKISQFNYIDIKSVDRDKKAITGASVISSDAAPSRAKQHLKKGDIIVSMTRPNLNAVAMVTAEFDCAIASTGFHIIRPKNIESKFIYYLVQSRDFIDAMCEKTQGALYPAVRPRDIESYEFWLPTSKGQQEIVTKIEELFSELDSGIASLKTAREQLKIYRQALLKHAFEGKLTEQWRKDNADKLETPEQLLARIQQERETRYQQQLDEWKQAVKDWEAKGKEGKKPRKPKKLNSFESTLDSEVQVLPTVPKNWCFTTLGEFIDQITAGKSFKCEEREPSNDEIGVAKVSAVTWGEYNETESKTCTDLAKINSDYFIETDDFIFSRANTIELVGACVIAKKVTKKIMLSDKTLRIKFMNINKLYILHYLRSHFGRKEIMERSTGNQESMRNIGQERIKSIVMPICSLDEQQEIVNQLEEKLSIIEQNEKEIENALAKAELLRQSILKKAFSGQLI